MDNEFHGKVREFHEACEVAVNAAPTESDAQTRCLRVRLLMEEALEFARASGVRVMARVDNVYGLSLTVEPDPMAMPSLCDMAHELADVQYVTSGAALTFGIPLGAVFDEVHAANMRKVGPDGTVVRRPDGKVVKPEGWRGPDVAAVLARTK